MPYNILIVDDYDLNRNLVKLILEKKIGDTSFFEAENGIKALEAIKKYDIDLVILDLIMPEKNGFQVLSEIKADEKNKDIPVIVNSSINDMDNIQKALQIGALDYFVKPLKNEDLTIMLPLKAINALKYYEQKKSLSRMNAQMNKELEIAKLFQESLMTEYKNMGSAEMYGRYIPCGKIGGDFFECIRSDDDHIWFIIADVCGHGVVTAMISSMIKIAFISLIKESLTPGEVIDKMNILLCSILGENNEIFFSAVVGVINNDYISYANAGHFPPLVINPDSGISSILPGNNMLAGIDRNIVYDLRMAPVNNGDCIILYTDGLFENYTELSYSGWERVNKYCIEHSELIKSSPEKFLDDLVAEFSELYSSTCKDDITLMLICLK